jgi:hypothetical protein
MMHWESLILLHLEPVHERHHRSIAEHKVASAASGGVVRKTGILVILSSPK